MTTPHFSPSRLDRMHDAMRRHVDSGRVPGLVTLVSRRGEEHVDAIGTFGFESNVPMRHDTIFRLASMTKPITAVATMTLVEECRLRLDEPVDRWLPELADRKVLRTPESALDDTVPARRAITLRDLLTFRCGYGEVFFSAPTSPMQAALVEAGLPLAGWPFAGTPEDFMKRLGALPLVAQPGERWLYHMPAEILGVLIARVTGKPLGAFLRERIFEPLGMKDTDFYVPEGKLDRLPICYVPSFSTGELVVRDPARGGLFARPPAFEGGGGGLVSTVSDLSAFGRMLARKGRVGRDRILSRTSVEIMTTDHVTAEQKASSPFFPDFWDRCGWGLGLGVITRRLELGRGEGSFGWDGAFGTSFWVDPKEDLVGVLMIQRSPDTLTFANPVGADFWTGTYQSIDD
ncbi:MAG TPA: serine hydrolase domain-containing protein [Polyangiaceae bacterium]|nr:serine hydrolase domain-containing protein [Polyangiaceae bacterium]